MQVLKVAIIGASGYTGLELIKILFKHKYFDINYLAAQKNEGCLSSIHKSLKNVKGLEKLKIEILDINKAALNDVIFVALPHIKSMEVIKNLFELNANLKIIDLSADYRLNLQNYKKTYEEHLDPDNLIHAVYGLPELNKSKIKNAKLIANPGCYPSASLLALLPFKNYLENSIFIDAKSGVSGAGKKLTDNSHFVTINDNMFAYNPLSHRHQIEIHQHLSNFINKNLNINFVPHLCPVTRGMLISIYTTLKVNLEPIKILKDFYKNAPFVRIFETPVNMNSAIGTNFCDIFAKMNGNDLFINSSIDNLTRGASSQAVVNANIMCNFDELEGIELIYHGI